MMSDEDYKSAQKSHEDAIIRTGVRVSKVSRAKQSKSLMEDSGYTRSEATALVDAGFGELTSE